MIRSELFAAIKPLLPGGKYTDASQIAIVNGIADKLGLSDAPTAPVAPVVPVQGWDGQISVKIMLELLAHEALVLEWYKDSVGVGTWGMGVTNASGHSVDRYKDKPQSLEHTIAVAVWLVRNKYAPAVIREFAGHKLTEAQFAAALSFHYNTGAIARADWCEDWKAGRIAEARTDILDWNKPKEIVERRTKERNLFFDGKWSQDGKTNIYEVRKPSYSPNWATVRRVDVRAQVAAALGAV